MTKIVVFDIDETMGYFSKLGKIWQILNNHAKAKSKAKLGQSDFNVLLELFPEFIRPHLLTILTYIKYQKKMDKCNQVMIYTNNQSSADWIQYIKTYFEIKLKYPLFDKIISAFKINGKRIEPNRTTHKKTHQDLLSCSKIPINAQICFIDNTYYKDMDVDNVVYIKVKPYIYDLTNEVITNRITSLIKIPILFQFSYTEKSSTEYEIDKIVSKKLMLYLQNFFK
jgi:hypothetical protein